MRRRLQTTGACLAIAAVWATPAMGGDAAYVPGEVLVGLSGDRGEPLRILLPDGVDAAAAAAALAGEPGVAWAEPNHILRAAAIPGDPRFPEQWGLQNTGQIVRGSRGTPGADIAAPPAWDRTTGDPGVHVAVVDGGVDLRHPDLAPNLPPNPGEAGGGREANGIDDDGNGRVDDVFGWDFFGGDADPTEADRTGHGAHVTGIVAAAANGIGVSGVAPRTSVVSVRALGADGEGRAADIAAAFRYASARGARVVNASLGGDSASSSIESAIRDAPNTLFIVAAGNEGRDVDFGGMRSYPCDSPAANVLCVTASDRDDRLPDFANAGHRSVDIAAPGVDVLSTVPGGGYAYKTGTSMAAPHASGVAALALAASPRLSTVQLRDALITGAVPRASLTGHVASGARLSATGTLASLPAPAAGPPAQTLAPQEVTPTSARLMGRTGPTGQTAVHHFEIGTTAAYGRRTPQRLTAGARSVSDLVTGLVPGTTYHARLVTATISGVGHGADITFTTPDPSATVPPAAAAAAPPAQGPVATAPAGTTAGRPAVGVRRVGRAWLGTLTLPRPAVVSGRLQRRVGGRLTTVRGFRRRSLDAGAQAFALGRLGPGAYRLRFDVGRGTARVTVARSFRVAAPLASGLRVRRRGAAHVAALSLSRPARVEGRIVRLGAASRPGPIRVRPRNLRPGGTRLVPLPPLVAGHYRLTLVVRAAGARRVLTHTFTVRPPGRDGTRIVFRSPTTER